MQKYRARHVNTSICLASLEPKYTHADIPKMTLFLKKASNEFENTDTANPVNSRVLDFSKHGVKSPYGYPKKDLTPSWVSKPVILSSSLKH